jgi:uncharacterized membrane protein
MKSKSGNIQEALSEKKQWNNPPMALWVPVSAMLFRRVALTLWHAFMFLGLKFFPLFFFLLGGLHCFFL